MARPSNEAVRALLTLLGERRDVEVLGLTPGDLRGKKLKSRLASEFNGKCAYCKKKLGSEFDVDHIIPINQKDLGMQMYGNLAPACKPCNMAKGGKNLLSYLEEFHPNTAEEIHTQLTARAKKWGADLDSTNLRKLVADFYQDISKQVLKQTDKALALLPKPSTITKTAAKEIRKKADYDFSEVAKLFPVGAFVRAELDGKIGEVVDYTLEGPKKSRRPNVKFFVAEDNRSYRRSPTQIKLVKKSS
jgi:hypothetical protein